MHREEVRYIGADEAVGEVKVSIEGIERGPKGFLVIGVLVEKLGATDGNMFGYWPMTPATWLNATSDEWEIEDVHMSLRELCADYDLPLDEVIDRIGIELIRANMNRRPA